MTNNSSLRVLLVDDDEDDYFLTNEVLSQITSFDMNITWASSYKEAERLIQGEVYDLFIFDFFLGQKTGLELAEIIIKKKSITPIIILTGIGNKDVDEQASDLGVYDYLVKNELDEVTLERSIRYSLKQAAIRRELVTSEQQFKSVIEHSSDIIFIADSRFKLMSVSNSVEKVTGYKPNEIIGDNLLKLLASEESKITLQNGLAEEGKVVNMLIDILTTDSESKPANISCSAHSDLNGSYFVHGSIIDKTDEQRAEKARMMNEKMEATARLMRTLAHEVRNPLSSISLAVESMEVDEGIEEQKMYRGMIKRNTSRIDEIITKVLNSARIHNVDLEPMIVQDVMLEAIRTVQDRIALQGIELIIDIEEQAYEMLINYEQLSIALTNILVNAIEAMQESTIKRLEITYFQKILRIEDSGVGISEEEQNRLFEPYFTTKKTGVGLGLVSTLNILKAHKIKVNVDSTLGKGTGFTLLLP